MADKTVIMDGDAIGRALDRIASEIIERNKGVAGLALIGVQRRGVPLARMVAERIAKISGEPVPVGVLDITFYRDDFGLMFDHPVVNDTIIEFSVEGMAIVLVDDVIYTGRTTRAAIEAIMDLGRPKRIQLAALIDRGHRELPFMADYVGKHVPTSRQEVVNVCIRDVDGADCVTIERNGSRNDSRSDGRNGGGSDERNEDNCESEA